MFYSTPIFLFLALMGSATAQTRPPVISSDYTKFCSFGGKAMCIGDDNDCLIGSLDASCIAEGVGAHWCSCTRNNGPGASPPKPGTTVIFNHVICSPDRDCYECRKPKKGPFGDEGPDPYPNEPNRGKIFKDVC
ncbi:hypothetical protein COCCADRAFT_10527 [Bipolaris zeicola 26-R-13]|uniref:Uncharacterized protein n=1 Tax=Cochliobolus carbonum (strain 26-R-13) TaxID=930089 RepID=W6Y5Y3_COCC2|nr:uncharacterized protein COCCADRAFT_10527 [Bipolaris zeicola 26-R-13]EUC26671.1 hypothetical protein COCCADRAFT_10527 [Bipolaris zeicola 26-R-13]